AGRYASLSPSAAPTAGMRRQDRLLVQPLVEDHDVDPRCGGSIGGRQLGIQHVDVQNASGVCPTPKKLHDAGEVGRVHKSVTLNLKSPRGLEIVRALLKKADITIENMAPGTIERLGLGY